MPKFSLFSRKPCPLARLKVKAEREPAVVGDVFRIAVCVEKLDGPRNQGKSWGGRPNVETFHQFTKLHPGRYRVTAEVKVNDLYFFKATDAQVVDLVKQDPPMEVTLKIKPIELDKISPEAAWKQYINLELTEEDRKAGMTLVTHDVQTTRAAAALVAANGDVDWTAVATQFNTDAAGKAMDPLQLGRVLEVKATLKQKIAGVKVFFGFSAEGANPAWAGASDKLRAAICMRRSWGKDKWETTFGASSYTKTDANGVATARLRLSRFGGDQFKAVASLKRDPLTNGDNKESALITAWRKIWYQASYNKAYPLMSLAQAVTDYAGCFVELEAIDNRPYAADASISESEAWQFDEGDRKGKLAPGQSIKVEVVPKKKDALPRVGQVQVSQTTSPRTVTRAVALRKEAKLKLNTADVTLVDKQVGQAFTPLSHNFQVQNSGHATLYYSVAKTRDWITLSRSGGSLAKDATENVTVTIDGDTVNNLAPGDYEETLTFTNARPAESIERKIKLKVLPDVGGALVVTPPAGLTSEGKVGGPFGDPGSTSYTLENKGGAAVKYSASVSDVPWLTVTYKARTDLEAAAKETAKEAKLAEDKVAPLEQQATEAEQQAETAGTQQTEIKQAGESKLEQAQVLAASAAQQATTARQQAASRATERDRVTREEDVRVLRADRQEKRAQQEYRRLQDHADGVLGRAKTPEAKGEAERAQEEADEAREQANLAGKRLEQAKSTASSNKKRAQDAWSSADKQARVADQQANTAGAAVTSARQQAQQNDQAAAQKLEQATASARQKRDAATQARTDADAAKQKAADAKTAAEEGVGTLASAASTTVTVTINAARAAELGGLPAQKVVTFTDETNSRSQRRTVRLAKPGKLKLTGDNYEPTAQAGLFGALSQDYTVENEGDVDLAYSVTKTKPWVTLSNPAGTLRSGSPVTVKATVNADAINTFEAGEYEDKLTFKDITHNVVHEKEVKVTVTANANPVLVVLPYEGMEGIGNEGGPFNPATKTYTIKNIGGAATAYTVSQSDWLAGSSPGQLIAVGDHNKAHMWTLRQQPADQRPRTVQLVVCQKQCDPGVTDAITTDSVTRSFELTDAEVVNADGDEMEVVTPPIDGQALIAAGTWSWNGHTGNLAGHDDWITIERGRANLSEITLTLPAHCPGCAACPAHVPPNPVPPPTPITPSPGDEAEILGLTIRGHRSFLGEGGYESRPTCLIVAEPNNVDDFNDTVSHELGHMLNMVLHKKDHQEGQVATAKSWQKDSRKELKALNKSHPDRAAKAKEVQDDGIRLERRKADLKHFWPDGVPVHPRQYDQGQGNHCGHGGTRKPLNNALPLVKYKNGSCILYDAGRDIKLSWCADCIKLFKFTNMTRFCWGPPE